MSRGLTNSYKSVLSGSVLYPALFAEFEFEDSTTRFWTGEADKSWNGYTWTGGGPLISVEFSGEGQDIQARSMTFTLNGVDKSYYSTALSTLYRGRPVRVYFNCLDSTSGNVVFSYLLEEARMDVLSIVEDDATISLQLTCESRFVDLFSPNRVFLNSGDHHKYFINDNFYDFVPKLPGREVLWGLPND